MILYLDTSALVPLLVTEASSARCRSLWDAADLVLCSAIGHVEASAALARAQRSGRLSPNLTADAATLLDALWSDIAAMPADEPNLRAASAAALRHGLRGFDAVHCAAAQAVADPGLVAASGDRDLLAAWRAEDVQVVDTFA
ncbi:type II toxin-antitoxin system VapC family toxin [Trujillonella endophytica]|uniref:Ribonuclease VapC n=1 Tax=Trujillonella endophytica TaxID=673521 RepID=A0A1H8WNN1_9ACTN|nr:type II toxin-antitoxin system VapC family toxin [Trujillella endophytica]SEP28688.1 Predicted nucleic acid-binding protein, contains PIN domain [Trujillella endophytica]